MEVTPEPLFFTRRKLLKSFGWATGAAALGLALNDWRPPQTTEITPESITCGYNNYIEFEASKYHERVPSLAASFQPLPWTVEVTGLVEKPLRLGIEEILKFPMEDRTYPLRCVEGWSLVVPWRGFPLKYLLDKAKPLSKAGYVKFISIDRPEEMPIQRDRGYPWPYTEGLRLDEAMHPLTLLAVGAYGKTLLPQNGAPIRLVVPWKYGFKSAKAIVRIELVEKMFYTFWMEMNLPSYGFFANVNPDVDHPVWSQSTERRIGEFGRRPTLMFNGYADQVAHLYQGMDLKQMY